MYGFGLVTFVCHPSFSMPAIYGVILSDGRITRQMKVKERKWQLKGQEETDIGHWKSVKMKGQECSPCRKYRNFYACKSLLHFSKVSSFVICSFFFLNYAQKKN